MKDLKIWKTKKYPQFWTLKYGMLVDFMPEILDENSQYVFTESPPGPPWTHLPVHLRQLAVQRRQSKGHLSLKRETNSDACDCQLRFIIFI